MEGSLIERKAICGRVDRFIYRFRIEGSLRLTFKHLGALSSLRERRLRRSKDLRFQQRIA